VEVLLVNNKYSNLFSSFNIGKVALRNRIVKTAAQTYFFESGENRVGSIAKAFYGAVARGGAGLIIVETPAMEWPLADTGDRRFRIDDDKYIENIRELTSVIHEGGCPAFVQFYHRGPWGGPYHTIAKRVAASAVTVKSEFDVHEDDPPQVLTIEEIEEITERYASGAVRAAEAGFDGLEINAAADHLFHTFLSRFWNKRDDIYGPQNMENRTRFLVNIIREIKKRAGADFPVQILMNAIEIGAGEEGLSIEEAKEIARIYQEVGVDSLHVRSHWLGMHQGSYLQDVLFYPDTHIPIEEFPKELDWSRRGALANVPLAAIIKDTVSIPVMTVGGFDADLGEKTLREGKTDLIGINRRFFADPEYANKVLTGRMEDIQPCTHCGNCTRDYNVPRRCRINPSFGTDQYEVAPAGKKKRVVVIGGGPAGMQVAVTSARRGHEVTLYEKGHYLGGSLPLAAMVKGLKIEDLPAIVKYFKNRLAKSGVAIKLGADFDLSAVSRDNPDAVIVAVGGSPVLPEIPGIDRRNVIKSSDLYGTLRFFLRLLAPKTLRNLTKIWMPVGRRVVIIGGAIQGCQLGEYLVKRGRQVTIVDTAEEIGAGLYPERKTRLFYWFNKKGVSLMAGVKLVEVTENGLTLITREGEQKTIEADSIIPALPLATNTDIFNSLQGKVPEVYAIGDCENPGIIPDATAAGWQTGNKV